VTAAARPRVPAGQSGGGQFAPQAWMFETGPLPFLDRPSAAELPPLPDLEPTAENPVIEVRPNAWRVYAPKCPHGHFAHWAAKNCKPCQRSNR
jgi:hypothetical protein